MVFPTKALLISIFILTIIGISLFYAGDINKQGNSVRIAQIFLAIALTIAAGIVSGLTLGLMSLDETKLKILLSSGTPQEQSFAARIIPIRSDPYLLLCTLLAANAVISESLPIVIDRILGESWKAILSSTLILLLFGELIPQAYFSIGCQALRACSCHDFFLAPLVYPLSFALKWLLGKGAHQSSIQFKREELKALMRLLLNTQLTHDEVDILTGVLDLIGLEKTPRALMTPLNQVFMLDADTIITPSLTKMISQNGYSRIPLFTDGEKKNVVSILLTRTLLSSNPGVTLGSLAIPKPSLLSVSANCSLFELLRLFREGNCGQISLIES
ncbi:hypothetical protein DI09_188p50 [Mitosporidium daphniae]|uniref:CNNM transmembrane domain-containing protein n=1 Tax=Mitosporidium daphniae TaxID=1485682 RepID=A0A098VX70_9MICR|nr:uncharacterized protein DI09_188p50 [Mitosporidium daphniae]KGG52336.1 hypothetical protein DI09_188p50 [Mitosporidium daphniae]|eukprot:XP_013238772.1 uncharacterized protein DI09_188p50 [Mitosporidium daphniae]